MILYPGMSSSFITMVFDSGITTPLYYYALIPLLALVTLIVVNFKELVATFDYKGIFAGFTGASKKRNKL
jgi:phosphate starvation-inducible membrane PsiE